jgi:hypothetical protein
MIPKSGYRFSEKIMLQRLGPAAAASLRSRLAKYGPHAAANANTD